jgi:hypothetical protein
MRPRLAPEVLKEHQRASRARYRESHREECRALAKKYHAKYREELRRIRAEAGRT